MFTRYFLLGILVLGHSLSSFRNSVLGQLSREKETDSSLDFARGDSVLVSVASELTSFHGDAVKDIIDERVHNLHRLGGDTSLRVDLLQHLVNEGGIGVVAALCTALLGWKESEK